MPYVISGAEERQRNDARKVLDCYVSCRTASCIVASNPDHSARPSMRWTPVGAHYQADVEHTAGRLPRPELREAFWKFAARYAHGLVSFDQPLDCMTSTALARAGRLFQQYRLLPIQYFRRGAT